MIKVSQVKDIMQEINSKHLLEEKTLIVPSYSTGRQLIQYLLNKGVNLLNLQVETINGLALDLYNKWLYKQDKKIIEDNTASILIYNILHKLQESERLKYFKDLQIRSGISRAIYSTIKEIRSSGFRAEDLQVDNFISTDKAHDIKNILAHYEKSLIENNFLDNADIYQLLIDSLEKKEITLNHPIYIRAANLEVNYLERKFLDILIEIHSDEKMQKDESRQSFERKNYILPLANVAGVKKPSSYYSKDSYPAVKFLDYLYQIDSCPAEIEKPNLIIKKSYGESNEVKEVLRELKRRFIPLDKAAVYYTSKEPYSQLFYDLSCKDKLAITYGEGINIRNTAPAKLYFYLLKWISEDYSARVLSTILNSGILRIDEEGIFPAQIASLIREEGIAYGRERYCKVLTKKLEKLESRADIAEDDYRITRLSLAIKVLEDIFKQIPAVDENGQINTKGLISGLAEIIKKYSRISAQFDAEAAKIIIDELDNCLIYLDETDFRETIQFLEELIDGLRVGVSQAQEGHLHISSYSKGLPMREYNFVLGLDSNKFPSQGMEDPILLDIERENLGRLELKRDKQKDERYKLAGLITNLEDNIYLSFSCFDTIENRENTPASILLQLYRLCQREEEADYSDLLNSLDKAAEFIPYQENDLLDEAEYCLYRIIRETEQINIKKVLENVYLDINQGIKALQNRKEGFNQYNGKIELASKDIDPRESDIVFSASRFELIAKCPYCYFLKYILKVKAPEDIEYDAGRWLDPLKRGSLLHSIYESFYREICSSDQKPSFEKHWDLLCKITEEKLQEQRQEWQPLNETIYQIERNEILQSCRVFLLSEEENADQGKAIYFELAFGKTDQESNEDVLDENSHHKGINIEKEVVEIELASGKKVKIRGFIDRIDQLDENTYNIIDYKTGSTYGYSQRDYFKKGRQLQHALYALALEEIFTEDINVELAGYIFPSLKGEGQRYLRPIANNSGKRKDIRNIIEILLDTISSGTMVMTDDSKDCRFCDYQLICEPDTMIYFIKSLRKDSEEEIFEVLRRLGDYA